MSYLIARFLIYLLCRFLTIFTQSPFHRFFLLENACGHARCLSLGNFISTHYICIRCKYSTSKVALSWPGSMLRISYMAHMQHFKLHTCRRARTSTIMSNVSIVLQVSGHSNNCSYAIITCVTEPWRDVVPSAHDVVICGCAMCNMVAYAMSFFKSAPHFFHG